MRPRRFHLKDGTDEECGEMLNDRCQGCGRKEPMVGTFRTGPRRRAPIGGDRPMTRDEYVAWKSAFLDIPREQVEQDLDRVGMSRAGR